MDVDGEATHPSQSAEDIQSEAKRARVREVQTLKRGPLLRNGPEPYWKRADPAQYKMSEKRVQHARAVGELFRDHIRRFGMVRFDQLNMKAKEAESLLSEKTHEVMHPSDSVRVQNVKELKSPRKENATPNSLPWLDKSNMEAKEDEKVLSEKTEKVMHLPDLFQNVEELVPPRLPNGHPCSKNKSPVEYCMSYEFIEHLGNQAKLYFSRVKQLSPKEVIANGFKHMNDEAFLAFVRYVAEKDLFEGLDYKFGELLHHCYSVEENREVYCHYNFTIEMKKKDEECWTSSRYFAETKLICGMKFYFCSPLTTADDGQCYSCTNQGVSELKHPSEGGYQKGHEGSGSHFGYTESYDDEECGELHLTV